MKRPLSIIIISKDPRSQQEVHNRFDVLTRFPRLSLLGICLRVFFGVKL
jgi:anthranilate/para-aminobenzoate synthase component II